MSRARVVRWLPFAAGDGAALVLWGLAAAHGYGWSTLWLPGAVAGVAWPRRSNGP